MGQLALDPHADVTSQPADSLDERRVRRRRYPQRRRQRAVRAHTISLKRMTQLELALGRELYPASEHADVVRPSTRGDCVDGPRPCPFVSCVHHLYLDASTIGSIKLNFPDLEPEELTESCALDVADRQGSTLEQVGLVMNLTRERTRQIELRALAKVRAAIEMRGLRDLVGPAGPPPKRRLPVLEEPEASGDEDFDVERFASETLD